MAIYSSNEQLYAVMSKLFEEVRSRDPKAAEKLQKAKVLLRIKLTEPQASIVINGRHNPATFTFNENRLRPEVDVDMAADMLHQILLGYEKLSKSLANGGMRVRGPFHKALALADLFRQCQDIYPLVLEDEGIDATRAGK